MKKAKVFSFTVGIMLALIISLLVSCNNTPVESTPAANDKNPPNSTHTHVWTDASCTSPKTCECGATEGEAKGHSYVTTVTSPTCNEKGYTTYTCECGDTYKGDETDALGHTWINANCTTPKTCSVCKTTEGEAKGHSYNSVVNVPTCTDKGFTLYTCECGEAYVENVIDPLGHDWTDATCTSPKTCSVCNATEGEAGDHSYISVITAPTCTENGYTTYTCECGDTYKDEETDALGHTWTDATCTAPKTCSVCNATEGETGDHSYTTTMVMPSCTENGYTLYICECGDTYKDNEMVAFGHSWADATCTAPKTCNICNATEGEAKGHSYSSSVIAPTCTEKGYTVYTCACGHTYKGEETGALGHTWADATCTSPKTCSVCKATEGEAVGHVYTDTVSAPTCKKYGYTTHTCVCGDTYKDSFVEPIGHEWTLHTDGKTKICQRFRCGTTQLVSPIPDDKNLILGLDKIPIATPDMTEDELRELIIEFMRLQFSFGYKADMSKLPTGNYAYYIKNLFSRKNYSAGKIDNVDGVKLTLENGKFYGGIPYTGNAVGSLYRWTHFYDVDTGVMDYTPIYYSTVNHKIRINRDYGLSGHPVYPSIGSAVFGNSCSSSIFWGWARISNKMKGCWTHDWRSSKGYVQVGDYEIVYKSNGQIDFIQTYQPSVNSAQTMYKAYAELKRADGMVQDGHAIMIHDAPVVVYDGNNNIDPYKSYVVIMDQGGGWWQTKNGNSTGVHYSSPLNDQGDRYFVMCNLPGFVKNKYGAEEDMTTYLTYTFAKLYSEQFLPFTIPELAGTAKVDKATVNFSHSAKTITVSKIESLSITSNYYVSDVQFTVIDKNGNVMFEGVYADESEGIGNLKSASLRKALNNNVLYETPTHVKAQLNAYADGNYYVLIKCRISTGAVVTVYTGILTK